VLTSLSVLRDTGLELTDTCGDDDYTASNAAHKEQEGEHTDSTISLGGARDHVLDEITMARGIDDGDIELGGLELP